MSYPTPHRHHSNSKKRTEKKKPHWIYPGDLCWFKAQAEAYPALEDWSYSEHILRVMYSDEPVQYIKRTRDGRGGTWLHHIECLGLKYVFTGSIHDFTKNGPTDRDDSI